MQLLWGTSGSLTLAMECLNMTTSLWSKIIPLLFAQTFHGSTSASSQPHWDSSHFLVIHPLTSHTGSTHWATDSGTTSFNSPPTDHQSMRHQEGELVTPAPLCGTRTTAALWLKCGALSYITRHSSSNSSQVGQSPCLLCLFCSCVGDTVLWCQPALPSKNILSLGSSRSCVHWDSSWDFGIRPWNRCIRVEKQGTECNSKLHHFVYILFQFLFSLIYFESFMSDRKAALDHHIGSKRWVRRQTGWLSLQHTAISHVSG